MNRRPPPPPPPPLPPLPDLSGYRPSADRPGGAAPPVEHRFGPPAGVPAPLPRKSAQGPRGRVRKKMRRWPRVLAWTLGTLAVVAGGAVATLVAFAPVGLLRDQLVREVQVRTGRDLVIAGPTSLSVWPALAVSMSDVTLSAPPGMGGAPLVKTRRLDASVQLVPLLSRRLEIRQVVLTEPVFELRVDAGGRRSWDFAAAGFVPGVQYAQATGGKGAAQQGLPPELEEFLRNSSKGGAAPGQQPAPRIGPAGDVALGDIRINNGTVRYSDARSGTREEIRAIDLRLKGKSLANPLEAKGNLVLRGDRIELDARLGSPRALMEDRPSRLALAIAGPRVGGRFDGSVSVAKGPHLDGRLKLDATSLRTLAQWLGVELAPGPVFAGFNLEADLRTGPASVALTNAKARLDEVSLTGSASLDRAAGRPFVKVDVKLGALDLNPYLARDEATAAPPPAPGAAPGNSATRVRGFTRRSGWSEDPIDLAALGILDGEARIGLASLTYRELKLGPTQLALALKGRALRANLESARLYDGQGRGVLTLDGSGKAPSLAINLALDGVSGLPLLRDAAGFDWIDGKAKVQIAAGGQGATEKAIMESLAGKAELAFADGAIIGYDIPKMIRGLSQGRVAGFERVPRERTDFTDAGASFQIRNGVAETKDLRANSPLIRLAGAGTVGLGQRQIDLTLRPRVVGALAGPGGTGGGLSGLDLPFRIRGSWEKPRLGADLDSVIKNPGQAVDALRELGKQIQQGKGGERFNRFLDRLKQR